jgi:hypothetical protein
MASIGDTAMLSIMFAQAFENNGGINPVLRANNIAGLPADTPLPVVGDTAAATMAIHRIVNSAVTDIGRLILDNDFDTLDNAFDVVNEEVFKKIIFGNSVFLEAMRKCSSKSTDCAAAVAAIDRGEMPASTPVTLGALAGEFHLSTAGAAEVVAPAVVVDQPAAEPPEGCG